MPPARGFPAFLMAGPLDISLPEPVISPCFGGVAQLARALEWHSRGRQFNSDHLHEESEAV